MKLVLNLSLERFKGVMSPEENADMVSLLLSQQVFTLQETSINPNNPNPDATLHVQLLLILRQKNFEMVLSHVNRVKNGYVCHSRASIIVASLSLFVLLNEAFYSNNGYVYHSYVSIIVASLSPFYFHLNGYWIQITSHVFLSCWYKDNVCIHVYFTWILLVWWNLLIFPMLCMYVVWIYDYIYMIANILTNYHFFFLSYSKQNSILETVLECG